MKINSIKVPNINFDIKMRTKEKWRRVQFIFRKPTWFKSSSQNIVCLSFKTIWKKIMSTDPLGTTGSAVFLMKC